jgi:hypothetical protein
MDHILSDTKIAKEVHLRKLKDLLSLWKAYEKRLRDLGWYDESDVMTSACQLVKDSVLLKQTTRMIIAPVLIVDLMSPASSVLVNTHEKTTRVSDNVGNQKSR